MLASRCSTFALVLLAVTFIAACSGSATSVGDVAGDGGPSTEDGASSADGSGACHTLAQRGSRVDLVGAPGERPAPTGGTIASGTYVATAARAYGVAAGKLDALDPVTFRFSGSTLETVASDAEGSGAPERHTQTVAVSGPDLTLTDTCSSNGELGTTKAQFSATPTTFTLALENRGILAEIVFTKQ